MINIEIIEEIISTLPYVDLLEEVEVRDQILCGKIKISFEGLDKPLEFQFQIYPQYPLKHHESESITFINKELLDYNHVMENGSICIHTSHCMDATKKLIMDINSLKQWIERYYINEHQDLNYEHIIVPETLLNDRYCSFIFSKVNHDFQKNEFGKVSASLMPSGIYREKAIDNFLTQSFLSESGVEHCCGWSENYKNFSKSTIGIYIFIEDHPAKHKRFAFTNWLNFKEYLSEEFLNYLKQFDIEQSQEFFPIFFGYKTVDSEIYWQVSIIESGKTPLDEITAPTEAGILIPQLELKDKEINWAIACDSSYKYFFGRGALSTNLTDRKILIIGVGALGSIIAKTLVRGGCKNLDIADYDTKNPENVCRSEYMFQFGHTDKVEELGQILSMVSPFLEMKIINKEYFESLIKILRNDVEAKKAFMSTLDGYDVIIDCTTDNDLMHILDSLELSGDLINMSITNHARELVCAFHPNIYHFVTTQFGTLLDNDLTDLYEPVGCWSPTFKASYNDINLLTQFALKHINKLYISDSKKNNFVIKTGEADELEIRIKEY